MTLCHTLPAYTHSPVKVLILDDDQLLAQTLQSYFKTVGFEARATASHECFFEQLQHWTPSIVVLDLLMPAMDGIQVIAGIAERGFSPKLVIVSGVGRQTMDSAQRAAQMRGLSVLGALPKPFRPAQLRELIVAADFTGTVASAESHSRAFACLPVPSPAQLKAAIENRDIQIVLQPKVFCRTGTLAGFEALARWQLNHRPVPPDQFIRLAEQEGLIDELTWLVFDQAIAALSGLATSLCGLVHVDSLSLAINISVLSLTSEALFESMVNRCADAGIEPQRIIFELTESAAMDDPMRSLETLTRLRLQGFKLSIDDFGTGFSSMAQLVRLPFSEIKVDKSFVLNALNSREDEAVVRSIVHLGQNLGMQCTAEGIENDETLHYLRAIGCDLAQGYGIGRPMPLGDLASWATEREQKREVKRLEALAARALMASVGECRFERLTLLARRLFKTPIGLITILDDERQLIKAGGEYTGVTMPRTSAICHQTLLGDGVLVIEDVSKHPVVGRSQIIRDAGFMFYAGHPLCLEAGEKAGAICVIDRKPRSFNQSDRAKLAAFATVAEEELRRPADIFSETTGLLSGQSFMPKAKALLWLSRKLEMQTYIVLVSLEDIRKLELRFGQSIAHDLVSGLSSALQRAFGHEQLLGHPRKDEMAAILMVTNGQKARKKLEWFLRDIRSDHRFSDVLPRVGVLTALFEVPAASEQSLSALFEGARDHLRPIE